MKVIIIAALSENNVIGKDNKLPWHIPEDLKRFKKLTSGSPVIMGRKTFESILDFLKKPLPDRVNIIITRNKNYEYKGINNHDVKLVSSIKDAIKEAEKYSEKVFVIGGAQIYKLAMPFATDMELTLVHKEVEGDTFFPKFDKSEWGTKEKEDHDGYSFVSYTKF